MLYLSSMESKFDLVYSDGSESGPWFSMSEAEAEVKECFHDDPKIAGCTAVDRATGDTICIWTNEEK